LQERGSSLDLKAAAERNYKKGYDVIKDPTSLVKIRDFLPVDHSPDNKDRG